MLRARQPLSAEFGSELDRRRPEGAKRRAAPTAWPVTVTVVHETGALDADIAPYPAGRTWHPRPLRRTSSPGTLARRARRASPPPTLSSAAGVLALQRSAGNRAVGAVLRARGPAPRRALHRLGYRLDKPLPSGAEKPKHGSDADQRRYSIDQFTKMWEAQFHALSSSEANNVLRGCVGITALNLGVGPLVAPTDLPSNKVYGTFAQARAISAAKNEGLGTIAPGSPIQGYVVYAMLFWSNRDPDDKKRGKPGPKALRPDPKTGEVDMSKIGDIYALSRPPDYTNFDFGFWDESTQTFWHANHGTYTGMKTPEETKRACVLWQIPQVLGERRGSKSG
jgi:hypothetical protein